MGMGKAGFVNTGIRSGEKSGAGELSQEEPGSQHQIREGRKCRYTRPTSFPRLSSSFGPRTISVPIPWLRVIEPQEGQ
jgi:hypothetical protein